jgi:hypothetical protein
MIAVLRGQIEIASQRRPTYCGLCTISSVLNGPKTSSLGRTLTIARHSFSNYKLCEQRQVRSKGRWSGPENHRHIFRRRASTLVERRANVSGELELQGVFDASQDNHSSYTTIAMANRGYDVVVDVDAEVRSQTLPPLKLTH